MANLSDYIVKFNSVDTLASVTARGSTTSSNITVGNLTSTGIDDNATSTALTVTDSGIAATLTTASQPNITSVGTLSGFSSTGIDDNATSTAITIDASENVGIGTTSVATKLNIRTDASDDGILLEKTDGTDIARLFHDGTTTNGRFDLFSGGSAAVQIRANGDTHFSGGNVGIGTTSPSAKLDISGAAPVLELTDTGSTASYGWQPTSNDLRLFDFNASLERLRIDSSGNVILNQSAGAADNTILRITGGTAGFSTLHLADTADINIGYVQYDHTNNALTFASNNAERMRIDSSGNLALGATTASTGIDTGITRMRVVAPNSNYGVAATFVADSVGRGVIISNQSGSQYLYFGTDTMGAASNNPLKFITYGSERVRIDSSGNLLVGTTVLTDVSSSGTGNEGAYIKSDGQVGLATSNDKSLIINRKTSDGDLAEFRKNGTTVGSIGVDASDNIYFAGGSGGTRGIYINDIAVYPADTGGSTVVDNAVDLGSASVRWKDLYLSGGAYLGGTGSGNYLDDYEEGNWTPTASSGFSSLTVDTSNCRYTKIGNTVHVRGEISGIGGQNAATFVVGGLPFTIATNVESSFSLMYTQLNIDTNYTQLVGYAQAGSNSFRIYECGDSQTWSAVRGDQTSSSTSLIFTMAYETS